MRLLAVVSYFAFFCSGTAVARQGYTNPVRDSNGDMVRVADPFVYRHGGVYYLIGTTLLTMIHISPSAKMTIHVS